jgi:hypothetical protein
MNCGVVPAQLLLATAPRAVPLCVGMLATGCGVPRPPHSTHSTPHTHATIASRDETRPYGHPENNWKPENRPFPDFFSGHSVTVEPEK